MTEVCSCLQSLLEPGAELVAGAKVLLEGAALPGHVQLMFDADVPLTLHDLHASTSLRSLMILFMSEAVRADASGAVARQVWLWLKVRRLQKHKSMLSRAFVATDFLARLMLFRDVQAVVWKDPWEGLPAAWDALVKDAAQTVNQNMTRKASSDLFNLTIRRAVVSIVALAPVQLAGAGLTPETAAEVMTVASSLVKQPKHLEFVQGGPEEFLIPCINLATTLVSCWLPSLRAPAGLGEYLNSLGSAVWALVFRPPDRSERAETAGLWGALSALAHTFSGRAYAVFIEDGWRVPDFCMPLSTPDSVYTYKWNSDWAAAWAASSSNRTWSMARPRIASASRYNSTRL